MLKNLLSVRQLTKEPDLALSFHNNVRDIFIKGKKRAEGRLSDDLYSLMAGSNAAKRDTASAASLTTVSTKASMWHARLGHPNRQKLQQMSAGNLYREAFIHDFSQLPFCEVCVRAKHTKAPYPKDGSLRAEGILQLVHVDLCEPVSVTSLGGGRYFLTIVDDFSRYVWVYILKRRVRLSIFQRIPGTSRTPDRTPAPSLEV